MLLYDHEDKDYKPFVPQETNEHHPCLVEAFFREEEKKPAHLRSRSCLISCPCPRCQPAMMCVGA